MSARRKARAAYRRVDWLRRPSGAALAVLAAGALLSGIAVVHQLRDNRLVAAARFDGLATRAADQLAVRLQTYEHAVRAARGAVLAAGVERIDRAGFRRYAESRDIAREFPGARGFGVIWRVANDGESAFVAAARRDGLPEFRIHQFVPHAGDRYVVRYIEPEQSNRQAIGLDIASEPTRRSGAELSMRTGNASLTGPLTLVTGQGQPERSFLLLLPIYEPGKSLANAAARSAATLGWAFVPLVIDDVLQGFDLLDGAFSLQLSDVSESEVRTIFLSPGGDRPAAAGLQRSTLITLYGRTWAVETRARPRFVAALNLREPRDVGGLGVALAGLLALLTFGFAHRARQARDVLALNGRLELRDRERTAMLEQARQEFLKLATALRDNQALLDTLDRHSIVSVSDRAGRIIDANANFCRISGYARHEVLGQPLSISNSGVHDRAFWDDLWRALGAGQSWRGEICNRARDGSLYWVDSIIAPFRDADGRIEKFISIRFDITARKAVEAKLLETSERFAIASASAGIGIWEFDTASMRLTCDDRMYRIYGLEPAVAGEPYARWIDCLHPEDRQRCEAEIALALRGERPFDTEFRIVRPDGEVRHLKAAARTLRGVHGDAALMTGVNFDVTDRRRAELRLHETSSLLQTVLDSAADVSIIATDPNLAITVFNTGAERLLGYRGAELIGRATALMIHDADELRERGVALAAETGQPADAAALLVAPSMLNAPREWTYRRKGGEAVCVSVVMNAMRNQQHELLGYLAVGRDVTPQKRYEESLRESILKAELASGAKSQFLANMSHEIRTPMNAVIGLSYLLGRTALDPQQAAFLAQIKLASKALLGVINAVLDLSKIEAGELIVEHLAFSPGDLLAELAGVMQVHADAKGIGFRIDAAQDLPETLEGDATRLNQILTNLLANAIKFTERGHVELRVRRLAATAQHVTLCFEIDDTGIGIAPEVQARLFAPFVQADATITRRFGGTGLGLSIVKRLVQVMGGDVTLASTPGVGSRFRVELDFALASSTPPGAVQGIGAEVHGESTLAGIRVLVVDDSAINLDVAQRILELEGAQVRLARNGLEALELLRKQPLAVDVVLMDVQMPVLDGLEATCRIRFELGLVDLPIVALTAGALTGERQRATAAGMDDFIIKPFDVHALVGCILRHVERPTRPGALRIEPPAEPPAVERRDWPLVNGIDAAGARARLGDDPDLFRSILERLLDEFSDVSIPAQAQDATGLALHARRMHKLKGSAGTVGATAIHLLASEAEAACAAAQPERAARLASRLAVQLLELRRSAEPVFEAARAEAAIADRADQAERSKLAESYASPDHRPLEPQAIVELIDLLRQQSLRAMPRFELIAPQLRRLLGDGPFQVLRKQIDDLEYRDAATALEAAQI